MKDDPAEHVRKSVGNKLNKLSEIAPDLVIKIAREWMHGSKNTNQNINNACRTMLKKAYLPVMELFGLAKPVAVNDKMMVLYNPKSYIDAWRKNRNTNT